MIGYCVIHKGFSKMEFKRKFAKQISQWSEKEKEFYFRYHLFFEELNSNINHYLEEASKFRYKVGLKLHHEEIKYIVENLKFSPFKKDYDEYIERIDEQEEKIAYVNTEIMLIKENMQYYQIKNTQQENIKNEEKKSYLKLVLFSVLSLILIFVAFMFIQTQGIKEFGLGENKIESTNDVLKSFSNLERYIGDYIKLQAKVKRFYYDAESGTKFLTLSDGWHEIEAVIFKNTKVPYIKEGELYLLEGFIQLSKEEKDIELKVIKIN